MAADLGVTMSYLEMLGDDVRWRPQFVNVLSQYAHDGSRNSTTSNASNRINLVPSSHDVHGSPGHLPQSWPPVFISSLPSSSSSVLSPSPCSSPSPSLTCRLSILCVPFYHYPRCLPYLLSDTRVSSLLLLPTSTTLLIIFLHFLYVGSLVFGEKEPAAPLSIRLTRRQGDLHI